MSTLHLNLKKKWFDMILSGEKKEEYREIKNSMTSKFINWKGSGCTRDYFTETLKMNGCIDDFSIRIKKFDSITFSNGYAKDRRQFVVELKKIRIGCGIEQWGATKDKEYFVLDLGKIISHE